MRLVSTRGPRSKASFAEAVQSCVPPGGGLWTPEPLPCFRDVGRLLEMDFLERSVEILHRMLGEEFSREDLDRIVREAWEIPLPLRQLGSRILALELFHGPSLAFQDFGARFLASLLSLVSEKEGLKLRTVLVATTGNTGAAAAQAFRGRKGFRVVVIHPRERVPELLERQIAPGGNVLSYGVEGGYEDCRAMVEACLEDAPLAASLNLTTAGSANIARVVAQVPLWFEAVARAQALSLRDAPVIAVPAGNGGNLCAGLMAQRMGLPVKAFVVATNGNDALLRALETGRLEPRPAVATLAPALDLGRPGNWERILALGDPKPFLRWGRCDDPGIRKSMWELKAAGITPDPHAAVAYSVLQERLGLTEVGILLATVHPAKSAELLKARMNLDVEVPSALAELQDRPAQPRALAADPGALKAELSK